MSLVKQSRIATLLDLSISGVKKLAKKDPSFPREIKCGDTRQSPVFYDLSEIEAWVATKKAARLPQAPIDAGV